MSEGALRSRTMMISGILVLAASKKIEIAWSNLFDRAPRARDGIFLAGLMAFAYCLIAVGLMLTFSGFVAIALQKNELYSTARI